MPQFPIIQHGFTLRRLFIDDFSFFMWSFFKIRFCIQITWVSVSRKENEKRQKRFSKALSKKKLEFISTSQHVNLITFYSPVFYPIIKFKYLLNELSKYCCFKELNLGITSSTVISNVLGGIGIPSSALIIIACWNSPSVNGDTVNCNVCLRNYSFSDIIHI